MKELIEKLISRLEESEERYDDVSFAQLNEFGHTLDYEYAKGKRDGVAESKEIVNELAEDSSAFRVPLERGGWIPVSERLPEENGYYLITIKYYHLHNNVTMGCFFDDGEWYKIDKDDKVIAWQPLPEPYKGE